MIREQNKDGDWVQAIPLPYHGFLHKKCSCRARFFTMKGYRGHYALIHILRLWE
jgi:hypothetical protein